MERREIRAMGTTVEMFVDAPPARPSVRARLRPRLRQDRTAGGAVSRGFRRTRSSPSSIDGATCARARTCSPSSPSPSRRGAHRRDGSTRRCTTRWSPRATTAPSTTCPPTPWSRLRCRRAAGAGVAIDARPRRGHARAGRPPRPRRHRQGLRGRPGRRAARRRRAVPRERRRRHPHRGAVPPEGRGRSASRRRASRGARPARGGPCHLGPRPAPLASRQGASSTT